MKNTKKTYKCYLLILVDFFIVAILSMASFLATYGPSTFQNAPEYLYGALIYSLGTALLTIGLYLLFRIYRLVANTFGIFDSLRLIAIALAIQIIGLLCVILLPPFDHIGQYAFSWATSTVALCFCLPLSRVAYRMILMFKKMNMKPDAIKTLVVGAGSNAKIVIDESRQNENNHNKVVALIDDDPNKIDGSLAGLPIKGPISKINSVIEYYDIQEVIIAISNLTKERLHEIISYISSSNVRVRRMPLLTEMQGPNDSHIIDVDLEDLLCRQPIILDNKPIQEMLTGKTVLVTGAGGSIGSELVRQIFATHPKRLVLFDIYENSTYDIQQELVRKMREEAIMDIELVTLIGSTYNLQRVESVIKKYRPDYIYHAAAYKHVPLMEDSPMEAIRTNVIGTYNVAKMADKYNVTKMLLVSTDKAVRPTNVMGATKRFAETIIQYFAKQSKHTYYCAVRFGNVLGSNGSVIPLFKKQIAAGGPITVTDARITRFFMTIPEAVGLILQSSLFAKGGEIFILDMGQPVKILSLAEKMIHQAGLVPYKDINIVFTGLRPGEKLYEELLLDVTEHRKTANKKVFIEEKTTIYPIENEIKQIQKVFNMEDNEKIKAELNSIVNIYSSSQLTKEVEEKAKKKTTKKAPAKTVKKAAK